MSIRALLKYELQEKTPEHSSFTVIRQRLDLEIYERIFLLTLREHGLFRGKNLGIDSSVIEANASLRALVNRNTEEQSELFQQAARELARKLHRFLRIHVNSSHFGRIAAIFSTLARRASKYLRHPAAFRTI